MSASDHAASRHADGRWKQGIKSPNPGGRPRSMRRLVHEHMKEQGQDAVAKQIADGLKAISDGDLDTSKPLPPLLEWYLSREWPAPKAVELSGPEGEPLPQGQQRQFDWSQLTAEERQQLAAIQSRLLQEHGGEDDGEG